MFTFFSLPDYFYSLVTSKKVIHISEMFESILAKNILPDWIIRFGIRKLSEKRLRDEGKNLSNEERQERFMAYVDEISQEPIAINTKEANEQHYELPPRFFELCLGDHLKYSSCVWLPEHKTLTEAEKYTLELTMLRAELKDGQSILELGCGWGSLTLAMAAKFPKAKITAISNSAPQRKFIQARAQERGLKNIEIITKDINKFDTKKKYDRIVSVEMFEHVKNYKLLFGKVRKFLKPQGKLFVHVFTHKDIAYSFVPKGGADFMSRYFFTGGTMPSNHLFLYFAPPLKIEQHWIINGKNYGKTSEAWLKNMDANKKEIMQIFDETYGKENAVKWFSYWRVFYLSVAEFFAMKNGEEWMVNHYLFSK
jgi:cyclopropane-fatty-acyl-phospholipid synthase